MTYDWKAEERTRLREMLAHDTNEIGGVLYWKANGAAVPADTFRDAEVAEPPGQKAARDAQTAAVFAKYRKRPAAPSPSSAEEAYELAANFAPGTRVVNILTGRQTRVRGGR